MAIAVVLAAGLLIAYPAIGQAKKYTIWPSGDPSGITDYNNLMNALNGPLGATANIRCVAGEDLLDGELIELQDADGDSAVFEFDRDDPADVSPGHIPVYIDDSFSRLEVAQALSGAVNSSDLRIDAEALPNPGYNLDWVLLIQQTTGTLGNGLPIFESVAHSHFIAQQTFEGGSDAPGPDPGDTIELTTGDFFLSRTVLVEGFNGTVKGSGKNETLVDAVREFQASGGGFGFAYDPYWQEPGYAMNASHFRFTFPESVTVKELTLQVTDPSPCDPVDYEGTITGLVGFALEIVGSTPAVVPEIRLLNVRIQGAAGDADGRNLPWGMFVALGESLNSDIQGQGNVLIESSDVNHAAWRGIVLGALTNGSTGVVRDCTIEKSGQGIRVFRVDSSRLEISQNSILDVDWLPLFLYALSGAEIRDNTISGGTHMQAQLRGCSSVMITDNTFRNLTSPGNWWNVPIFLRDGNQNCAVSGNEFIGLQGAGGAITLMGLGNNSNIISGNRYHKSELLGWNEEHPAGPGCVLLMDGAFGNYIDEKKFPPGTTLCEQIMDVSGANEIAGWPAKCE
jgi:hypothetical protein